MTERRPEPVVDNGWAAAAATVLAGAVVTALARRGLLLPESLAGPLADVIEVGIVAAVGAAGTLWAAYRARRKVTPIADPRDADGTPLQRADAPTDVVPVVEVIDVAAVEPDYPATVRIPVVRPGRHHPVP